MNSLNRLRETIMGIPVGFFHDRDRLHALELRINQEIERQNPNSMGAGHPCPYATGFRGFLNTLREMMNE